MNNPLAEITVKLNSTTEAPGKSPIKVKNIYNVFETFFTEVATFSLFVGRFFKKCINRLMK